ncbi:MAG: BREX system Lon protease-like protein BrxL [Candidatus Zipacnadales bacterium]
MLRVMGAQLDELILSSFPDVAVDKGVAASIGGAERAIPAFVRDWLVSRCTTQGVLDHRGVQQFLAKHLPDKQQRELLRNQLLNGQELTILDGFNVQVNLDRGERLLRIPSLDIFNAHVPASIVERNSLLLSGTLWGAGRLQYRRSPEGGGKVWMIEFQPMQTAKVDKDYFIEQRQRFSTEQWRCLLIRSMGYNPDHYSPSQQTWLIARLVPLVQPRINLIELAPKGTGKSFVFSQLSKYAWLISGGIVTRAKLFYDMTAKSAGVITKYDAVILDEVQTIRLQDEGEIIGALKGFLESGEFRVMGYSGNSEAGFALLANIPIGPDGRPTQPKGRLDCYFDTLPKWLHGQDATALLDRFHGLIPGWELPRIQQKHLARSIGLRADYLGEILHVLRLDDTYMDFVKRNTRTDPSGDLRDINAVHRLAAGFLRLLFSGLRVTPQEFEHYCLQPARHMRALIRKQLVIMDPEYKPQLAAIESTLQ